ncbi:MAG: DUF1508 domain-containing protein [Parcubacteria group bacterium]
MIRFEIFQDLSNQYRWRLVARNGEIVANSEAYTAKYSAIRSAERVKVLAGVASIVDITTD